MEEEHKEIYEEIVKRFHEGYNADGSCNYPATTYRADVGFLLGLLENRARYVPGWVVGPKCNIEHPNARILFPESCGDCNLWCPLFLPQRPATLREVIDGKAVRKG